jgi:hypothetical protein
MKGRGVAAILAIALASVMLIVSGGAGAQPGDENQCVGGTTAGSTGDLQMCTITASPGRCIQKSSSPVIVQKCIVTQTEDDNEVFVDQANSSSVRGSTQTATQITTITQQGTNNRADVKQDIRQTSHESGGGTQTQDGRQLTTICQGGAGVCASSTNTGTNVAGVVQSRWADAHASGGTITQVQDTVTEGKPADCDPDRPPTEPDLCARIAQNSTTRNDATLHQDDHLLAEASGTESITQTQGSGDGGIDGHATQQTISGTPQNTEDAHQHLTYDLSGPDTATQAQDPRIGGGTSGGKLNLHQVGILRASANDAEQVLGIDGLCPPSGSCLILESAKINGANFSSRCSSNDGCTASNIQCYSGEGEASCFGFPGKGKPPEDLISLGFDTSDFRDALNFTFPVTLPGL